MTFTLTVDMDNAAFEDAPTRELRDVLHRIMTEMVDGAEHGKARDTNGNTCGRWAVTA